MKPKLKLTQHAKSRMQQRGISDIQVTLIQLFGIEYYQSGNSSVMYLPSKKISEIRHALDKIENVTLIGGETGEVVTALHQSRKIRSTQIAA